MQDVESATDTPQADDGMQEHTAGETKPKENSMGVGGNAQEEAEGRQGRRTHILSVQRRHEARSRADLEEQQNNAENEEKMDATEEFGAEE